jgi:squalene-associated FAD-dependent desaturase
MNMGKVHIIGAGLAGLAAATKLATTGRHIHIYEAAGQAGGRCRSYFDATLGVKIDNGNHLVLEANVATRDYLHRIGGLSAMHRIDQPRVDFIDLTTKERWSVQPNKGLIPWWIFSPARRVLGTRAWDYLSALKLMLPGPRTITQQMNTKSVLFKRLWEPLFIAVLNTPLAEADSAPMWRVLIEIFSRGGKAMGPMVPHAGLGDAFVEPALKLLDLRGARVHFNHRLRGVTIGQNRVTSLDFGGEVIEIDPDDRIILATPAQVTAELLPDMILPQKFAPILNAHYRIDPPPGMTGILGVIGGHAEWIFPKPGLLSVTVSAAEKLIDGDREELARLLWQDVAFACGLDATVMPPWQIVKEKRATFRADSETLARRPKAKTYLKNMVLAGDYTDTGLPATIEGAIRSGNLAARLVSSADFG